MHNCKIRRNTFGNTKIYEIRDFMHVRWPVSRMAHGEMVQSQSLTGGMRKKSSNLAGNETHHLLAYSIVPHANQKA
jgi:hypothetical protein